jgi:hypothetical protein
MEQKTNLKPKLAEVIKAAGLVDENETMALTKVILKQSTAKVVGGAVKTAAKAIVTSTLFGFYSIPNEDPTVVALSGETVNIIRAPGRGFFIETPTVRQEEIDNKIQIKKEDVANLFYKKALGGQKLHIELAAGEEILIGVPKKLEPIFSKIAAVLGYTAPTVAP